MNKQSKVSQLVNNAKADGNLSAQSEQILNVLDIGAEIQAALGVAVDDVEASEVILVSMMPDDSGSIRFAGNAAAVRNGHNLVLNSLRASKQKDNILAHNRYLNGKILYPYTMVEQAEIMDTQNYNPDQGTPLYDQTIVLLGTVLAKAQEFSDNGVPARTITLIISDGSDQHSRKYSAKDVAVVVKDMLKTEMHIVAAMGIDDGSTDFQRVFSDMGIPDEWILTPKNTEKEIRQAFLLFSQSAVRASQSAANFSQAAMGGFGN
ncbi:MAG: hypothetical protein NUV82_01670 [Candidatus Komeilibacteria bacterium]|nr:hypothetical protein [Candidatus Komeilibacteria bacterium]